MVGCTSTTFLYSPSLCTYPAVSLTCLQKFERVWSWSHNGTPARGIFDVAWRRNEENKVNRFALALESGEICVVNANLLPELQ
jgi:hypothetical protein